MNITLNDRISRRHQRSNWGKQLRSPRTLVLYQGNFPWITFPPEDFSSTQIAFRLRLVGAKCNIDSHIVK